MSPYAGLIKYVVIFAVGAFVGGWGMASHYQGKLDAQTAAYAKAEKEATERYIKQVEQTRELEQSAQKAVNEIAKTYQDERTKHEAIVNTLRNERSRLLNTIGSYSTSFPTENPIATCRERASTLGNLLGEATEVAAEFARAAEQHSDEVRVLKRYAEEVSK
jgi:hypothetical protein